MFSKILVVVFGILIVVFLIAVFLSHLKIYINKNTENTEKEYIIKDLIAYSLISVIGIFVCFILWNMAK